MAKTKNDSEFLIGSGGLLGILRLERDEWLKYSVKRKSEGSFEGWNHAQAVAEGLDRAIRTVVESIPPNDKVSLRR